MIRSLLWVLCLGALAGCGTPAGDVMGALWGARNTENAAGRTAPKPDRAAIAEADLAAIVATGQLYGITAVAVAQQMRAGRIIYRSVENRSVTLNGGLVFTSRGFGTNLQAVETAADDPLVTAMRPADWPDQLTRTYRFSARGPEFAALTARCEITRGQTVSEITVVEVARQTLPVTARCITADGQVFINRHFIDPDSGTLWRSLQWTGPDQGYLLIDVIAPFSG